MRSTCPFALGVAAAAFAGLTACAVSVPEPVGVPESVAAAPDPKGRTPDEQLQSHEAMQGLEVALCELPARQREAFPAWGNGSIGSPFNHVLKWTWGVPKGKVTRESSPL